MAISPEEYQLKPTESIEQYNTRIESLRAKETPPTPSAVTPAVPPATSLTPAAGGTSGGSESTQTLIERYIKENTLSDEQKADIRAQSLKDVQSQIDAISNIEARLTAGIQQKYGQIEKEQLGGQNALLAAYGLGGTTIGETGKVNIQRASAEAEAAAEASALSPYESQRQSILGGATQGAQADIAAKEQRRNQLLDYLLSLNQSQTVPTKLTRGEELVTSQGQVIAKNPYEQIKTSPASISNKLALKYPDAGIVNTDSEEQITQKIKNSAIYKKQTSTQQQSSLNEARNALKFSRTASAINSVIKTLYPTTQANPINMYASSAQWINKLDTAFNSSINPKNTAKNVSDLEMMDAAVKINNGGQQITEAQINTLLSGVGYQQKLTVIGGKISGYSLLLTDDQRKMIKQVAENTIKGQEKLAKLGVNQVNKRLKKVGFSDNELLDDPLDVATYLNVSHEPNLQNQATDLVNEIVSQGAVDNGDGTYTMPDGEVVTPE